MTSTTSSSTVSLCIPRVFNNITTGRIQNVFDELDVGILDRIDLVRCENSKGEKFKRAYIHFSTWSDNSTAQEALEIIKNGGTFDIIYDDPWFWKCSLSRVRKPDTAPDENKVHRPPRKHVAPTIRTTKNSSVSEDVQTVAESK